MFTSLKKFNSLTLLKNFSSGAKIYSFKYFNSSSKESTRKFYNPDSPYVKEVTDAIYPKIPKYNKKISGEDLEMSYKKVKHLYNSKDYNEAFINANLLLNDMALIKNNYKLLFLIYYMLGNIQFSRKDYQSAIQKFLITLENYLLIKNNQDFSQDDKKLVQDCIFKIAISYSYQNEYSTSISYLIKLIESENLKYHKIEDRKDYLKILNSIADNYYSMKNFEKTFEFCSQIINEFDQSENENNNLFVDVYNKLGNILYLKKNFKEALKYFSISYNLSNNSKEINPQILFDNIKNLATLYYLEGNYTESINYSIKLEKFENYSNNFEQLIQGNHLLLNNYYKLNDFNKCLKYLFKLLEELKNINLHLEQNKKYLELIDDSYNQLMSIFISEANVFKNDKEKVDLAVSNMINYIEMNFFDENFDLDNKKLFKNLTLIYTFCINYFNEIDSQTFDYINKIEKLTHKMLYLVRTYDIKDIKLEFFLWIFNSGFFKLKKDFNNSVIFLEKASKIIFDLEVFKINEVMKNYMNFNFKDSLDMIKELVNNYREIYKYIDIENEKSKIFDNLQKIYKETVRIIELEEREENIGMKLQFLNEINKIEKELNL